MDLGNSWLCHASPQFCEAVSHLKSVHTIKPGSILLERGDPANYVFFVDSGTIRVVLLPKPTPVTRLVAAGAVLGLNEVITGSKYAISAYAQSLVDLSCISRESLLRFLSQSPEACMQLVHSLSEDLHTLYAHMASLRGPARRRRKQI
jgi:CRP-like cAMP-binding protein